EDSVLLLPVEKVRGGDHVPRPTGRLLPELNDPIGLGIGHPLQQYAVKEAENRRVRAQAERYGGHRDQSEAEIFAVTAQGETNVVPQHALLDSGSEDRVPVTSRSH